MHVISEQARSMFSVKCPPFYFCPRRVLAQTDKTRGGIIESPRIRNEQFGSAEKNLDFARTGLAKDCQNFAGGRINTPRK